MQPMPGYSSSTLAPLAILGTCQVTLSGAAGVCLPIAHVAQNGTNLANACDNVNLMTAGTLRIVPSTGFQMNDTYISIFSLEDDYILRTWLDFAICTGSVGRRKASS